MSLLKRNYYNSEIFQKLYPVKFLLIFIFLLISFPVSAWNAMGHRIIGEIAYQHLTPTTQKTVDVLIDYLSNAYPYSSNFQTANAWADYIKQDDIHAFDSWHFYDKPFYDASFTNNQFNDSTIAVPNLLWAINQAIDVLKSSHSNQYEKAFFLRFLLHLVGDAHQPLHCINRFTQNFPQGDHGGNLFIIKPPLIGKNIINNLHAYWDDGLGLFDQSCGLFISPSKRRHVICLANKFQQDYPPHFFGKKIEDLNPQTWLNDSYQLAVNNAYNIEENTELSQKYIQDNQIMIEQQVTLAGYRLANLLNAIFN